MQSTKGFSLIEVLVAMVIFSIASLALSQLMVSSTKLVSENGLASEAITLAQETLEDLRTVRFTNMTNGSASVVSEKGGATFNVVWTVTNNSPETGMNRVVVTVTWNHQGVPKSYEAQSIFANVQA
jgi:prepilin-type N-terminal cleavage/methylation domain-containing protein